MFKLSKNIDDKCSKCKTDACNFWHEIWNCQEVWEYYSGVIRNLDIQNAPQLLISSEAAILGPGKLKNQYSK